MRLQFNRLHTYGNCKSCFRVYAFFMVTFPAGEWFTLSEAAVALGISNTRISQLVKRGDLNPLTIGCLKVVKKSDVAAYKRKIRPTGRPPKI